MYCKRIICFVLMMCIAIGLCGCVVAEHSKQQPERKPMAQPATVLKELAYTDTKLEEDYTIYIREGEKDVPYLVLTDDYNGSGNALLLRKYVLDEPRKYNPNDKNGSYYPNILMDQFLSNEFFYTLSPETQTAIVPCEITVTATSSFRGGEDATEKIIRSVFLLAYSEVTEMQSSINIPEGEFLKFFNNKDHLFATRANGNKTTWWLRSAETYNDTTVMAVLYNGLIGGSELGGLAYKYSDYTTTHHIRPAFCINPNANVVKNNDKYYLLN